ncbi:MAG TPA: sialate O-acetylesterase [Gammaproteobacteria bacterium]|nr:sialate O-acetylesterase [Gammaproteobacteria bacterium]
MITRLLASQFFAFLLGNIIFINGAFASPSEDGAIYDVFNRLIYYPGKIETACPTPTDKVGTILVIGQSNASNSGEKKFVTKYPTKVFNYFNGKCYVASSPLLGTDGNLGEFMTPLADHLIEDGVYDSVLIIASSIGGSPVRYWQKGGYLNDMLLTVLEDASRMYKITEIIWHQGEADFYYKTTKEQYLEGLHSVIDSIRGAGTNEPPFYFSISTYCGYSDWTPENPIAEAQRNFEDSTKKIFLGADTDSLVSDAERFDHCHFKESGQLKTARAYATAIHQHKQFS